jgi:DIE2/ALG10 family
LVSYEHPFLLSDNRHFAFYVWRKVYRAHRWARYILIPGYVAAGVLAYHSLGPFSMHRGPCVVPKNSLLTTCGTPGSSIAFFGPGRLGRLSGGPPPHPRPCTSDRATLFHHPVCPAPSTSLTQNGSMFDCKTGCRGIVVLCRQSLGCLDFRGETVQVADGRWMAAVYVVIRVQK